MSTNVFLFFKKRLIFTSFFENEKTIFSITPIEMCDVSWPNSKDGPDTFFVFVFVCQL